MVKNLNDERINSMKKITIAALLISIGVISRIFLRNFLPPSPSVYINFFGIKQPIFIAGDVFFVIASISLISGRYLRDYFTFLVPFMIMLITDVFIGNNFIFLFTWSGFAIMGWIGYLLRKKPAKSFLFSSISSIILYDLWTNFGWWLGYYGGNLKYLTLCYTLAIPFMIWHLLSTSLLLPIFVLAFERIEMKEDARISKYSAIPVASLAFLSLISLIF